MKQSYSETRSCRVNKPFIILKQASLSTKSKNGNGYIGVSSILCFYEMHSGLKVHLHVNFQSRT
jgi:hypothetical protein